MARSVNKVNLLGNLARDPALRTTNNGTSVCNFTVVTNRDYQDANGDKQEIPEFHSVVAWGNLAEICSQFLHQGDRVWVEGRIQSKKYQGKDGVDRTATEIVISEMISLTPKSEHNDNLEEDVASAIL